MGFTKPQGKSVGGKIKKMEEKRGKKTESKKEKGEEKGSNLFVTSGDYLTVCLKYKNVQTTLQH